WLVDVNPGEAVEKATLIATAAGQGFRQTDTTVRRSCLEAIHLAARTLAELGYVFDRQSVTSLGRPPTTEEQIKLRQYREEVERAFKTVRPLVVALQGQFDGVRGCLAHEDPEVIIAACQTLESMAEARYRLLHGERAHPVLDGLVGAAPALASLLPHK